MQDFLVYYNSMNTHDNAANSVEAYVAAIPAAARPLFDELRSWVKSELSHAHEVVSYGVIGYKFDPKKRGVVFVSAGKITWRCIQFHVMKPCELSLLHIFVAKARCGSRSINHYQ
jgi:hypothetical protein